MKMQPLGKAVPVKKVLQMWDRSGGGGGAKEGSEHV